MLASLLEVLIREVLIQAFFFRDEKIRAPRDGLSVLEATLPGVVPETNLLEL